MKALAAVEGRRVRVHLVGEAVAYADLHGQDGHVLRLGRAVGGRRLSSLPRH
jgi:hypothetical protein